jgi:SAM-dependent methyltransferase
MGAGATAAGGTLLPWERIGTTTRYGRYATDVERRAIEKALALAAPPGTALDVGCEGGRWTEVAAARGWAPVCTEVNQISLDACKRRVPSATCILTSPDDTALPCATGSIGLLLCIEVGPVIHRDWFIAEADRVLRLGGYLVGVCWNRRSWRGFAYHSMPGLRVRKPNPWYGFPLSYPMWRRQLRARGFQFVHQEGYSWIPFRRASDSPLVPLAVALERALGLRRLAGISPMVAFVARKDA